MGVDGIVTPIEGYPSGSVSPTIASTIVLPVDEPKPSDAPTHSVSQSLKYGISKEMITNQVDVIASNDSTLTDEAPDGGRGWFVLFGSFWITFSTFGYINGWGVYQSYYQDTILADVSPSTIAWIGSVQYLLVLAPGLVAGRLFDLGWFRLPTFVATVVLVAATVLVAECTQFWQFFLCQGVVGGLACGCMFGPCLSVLSHWFKRKRGFAIGVATSGSAMGGTVLPIAIRRLIPIIGPVACARHKELNVSNIDRYRFKWTLRVIALILLVTLGFSNLTLRRRLPPKNVKGGLFNPRAFKSLPYSYFVAACFCSFLGMYTVLTYIDVAATVNGLDPDFSFYLVSIANGASIIGRLGPGLVVDKIGALNTLIPFTAVAGILTYSWPFATTRDQLIAIAIIYGITWGAFVSLNSVPAMQFGDVSDVGRRTGMMFSIGAIGALVGLPISGAIYVQSGRFNEVGYWAGSTIMVSTALMICSRQAALGRLRGKV